MKTLDEIPVPLSKDAIFKKLFEIAEVSNLTPAEMSAYQKELKRKRDNYSHDQHMLQKGIEQGIEQGEHKKAIEMAEKLIAKGVSSNEISELTGLSVKEIEEL